MGPLIWQRQPNALRAPALICAFRGWNDAATAATRAVDHLADELGASKFAHIDCEEFFDFQSARPNIRLEEGRHRQIVWPENNLLEARVPGGARDLVLLSGIEPSLKWRSFSETIVDLAEALGIQVVVMLGALLAEVPHTRPVSLTGIATDEDVLARLQIDPPSYEGPTGIVGILHSYCEQAGLPTVSLWAAVPHYVAAAPSPKATVSLLRSLREVVGLDLDLTDLELESIEYERRVTEAVNGDPEMVEFVKRLEQQAGDAEWQQTADDLPTGEAIAREFQKFLRQQGPPESP